MSVSIVTYRLTNSHFPKVPFLGRFDYWNKLASYRKMTISPAMDAIRSCFHSACARSAASSSFDFFPDIFFNLLVEDSQVSSLSVEPVEPVEIVSNEIPSWLIETIPLSVYSQDVQQNGYSTN